jgi:ABC-type transport system substrate-binding protein
MKYLRKTIKRDLLNELSVKNSDILKNSLMNDFSNGNNDRQQDESWSTQKLKNKIDQLRAEVDMYKRMYAEAEMQKNVLQIIIKENEKEIS